jgi:uncharacterized protein (DUF1800 family)
MTVLGFRRWMVAVGLVTVLMAGCGGAGGGSAVPVDPVVVGQDPVAAPSPGAPVSPGTPIAPTPPVVAPAPAGPGTLPPTRPSTAVERADASRLLIQATYGPTLAEIERAAVLGPAAWIEQQFATPSMDTHWDYVMVRRGPIGCSVCDSNFINATMESFWTQAVRGPDQLRQRMVFALSQIAVVSTVNSAVDIQRDAHASYLDMLSRQAFGTYRQWLEAVALHPTMGRYLSHLGNVKEDPATGRLPDENFAREVMQLFSIGLWQLNEDGTRKKDAQGQDIPTYDQADVMGLAKVFTGWSWPSANRDEGSFRGWNGRTYRDPMAPYPQYHSTSEKRFLGAVIPANTSIEDSLRIALDTLANHPNVGPFIGRQLIQRFVTSNPSPAYVARVSRAFADNGRGVRGDFKAVLRAVLLDPEARDPTRVADPSWGKLREPMIRFAGWMRAFDGRSPSDLFRIWNLEDPVRSIGQNPLRAPSVFNWYRPTYAPPGELMGRGIDAPEFQITHETTTTGYANFVVTTVERGFAFGNNAIEADYRPQVALAGQPAALVDQLDQLLTAGRMSPDTRNLIVGAVQAVPATEALRRVHTAVALVMLSPDFIVQK